MIDYSKTANLKEDLSKEKSIVDYYFDFETNVKNNLETYIEEFKEVSFDNEILKTMLLNTLQVLLYK